MDNWQIFSTFSNISIITQKISSSIDGDFNDCRGRWSLEDGYM